jgi:hypothetical protein
MKKLAAYMFLAVLVYVLIYFILIQGKRSSAEKTSAFCESLSVSQAKSDIEKLLAEKGFKSSVINVTDSTQTVLLISHPDEDQSVCKALIENDRLVEKQFVLSVF